MTRKGNNAILRELRVMEAKKKFNKAVSQELPNLVGERVRINMRDFVTRAQNGELSDEFIGWLEESGSKQYVVSKKYKDIDYLYELEDVYPWIFNQIDLLQVFE